MNEYFSTKNIGNVVCISGEWYGMGLNFLNEGTWLYYNDDVNIISFDYSGGSEGGNMDGECGGSQIKVS